MTHPTGPPPETREEPVKSFSLVTEILGGPQAETVSSVMSELSLQSGSEGYGGDEDDDLARM